MQPLSNNKFEMVKLTNNNGMILTLMNYGATWLSCEVPLASGEIRDVLLGCPNMSDYPDHHAFLGSTMGRYANRIKNASFYLDEQLIQVSANQNNKHCLHGGINSWDKRFWHILEQSTNKVVFSLVSAHLDDGFPGMVIAKAIYELTDHNEVLIDFIAMTDKTTPINMTTHAYFNLNGIKGTQSILSHRLQINADQFLPVDAEGIPNAVLQSVANTSFDFRKAKTIATDFLQDNYQQQTKGYDHAFVLNQPTLAKPSVSLWSDNADLQLDLYTTTPAVQVYTGNFLQGTKSKTGGIYSNHAGIALEPGLLPDSPNHPEWHHLGCFIEPNNTYHQSVKFLFLLGT